MSTTSLDVSKSFQVCHEHAFTCLYGTFISFMILSAWSQLCLVWAPLALFCSVLHVPFSHLLDFCVTFHCPVLVCVSLTTEQQKHLSHFEGMHCVISNRYLPFIFYVLDLASSKPTFIAEQCFFIPQSICHPPTAMTQSEKCVHHKPHEVNES